MEENVGDSPDGLYVSLQYYKISQRTLSSTHNNACYFLGKKMF